MARVLLVDDEPGILRAYSKGLGAAGHTIQTAGDGRDAVAAVQRAADGFDVIVSDISMPNMTGLDFLRAVRTRDLDVPVILMTGLPDVRTAAAAVEFGAFLYLSKPVTIEVLVDAVARASKMHALARLKRSALKLGENQLLQLGDRAALEVHFEEALAGLWMALQPIVSLERRNVFAYEVLMRSEHALLPRPMELLDAAERLGALDRLGRCCRDRAAALLPELPDDALLFVNLHPNDLNDSALFDEAAPLSRMAKRVVLEITERASLERMHDLAGRVDALRRLGYRIAVDDLGAGYAGLSALTQLTPDVVKLDMSLIRDIDQSAAKQRIVGSMVQLCRSLDMRVVTEGVETEAERRALETLECDLIQGYLFGRPERKAAIPKL